MKKIQVEFTEVGNGEFVAQAKVRIRVNGKFVENRPIAIIKEALDKIQSIEYSFLYNGGWRCEPLVTLTTLSGNNKKFKADGVCLDPIKGWEEYNKDVKKLVSLIKEIEAWQLEVHKQAHTYHKSWE